MEAPTPHLLLLLFTVSLLTATTADDGPAMLALAKSFTPPPSDWSTTSSAGYCKWSGVRCSSDRVNSITLEDKSLSGTLPPEISTLSELKTITLQRNKLSGKIPSFAKLTSLQSIYLDSNLFDSVDPGAFAGLTSLQILSMSDNPNLSPWTFPSELSDSTSLTTVYLDNTTISGVLPDIFESFASLQNLRLSYNNVTGPLPPSLAKSTVQNLWINNQLSGLSGSIQVLSGMTSLSQAWLHKNQFTGPIPDLSKSENLFDLQLRDNQLTGTVSPQLLPLGSLKNISLDNNKFQGPLPSLAVEKVTADHNLFCTTKPGEPCDAQVTTLLAVAGGLGYPSMLAESWQGNDACGSWAYVTCDSAKRVVTLNLAKHGFQGFISPAIVNLTSLKSLYLNDNNLTGFIPKGLTSMPTLQLIDVSNNNLTGEIPKFPAPVKFTYKPGNVLLGTNAGDSSSPGNGAKGGGGGSGGSSGGGSGGGGSKAPVIVGVIVAVLVFLAILGFVVYKFVMKKKYGKFRRTTDPENAGKVLVSDAASSGNGNGGGYGNGHGGNNFNALNSPSSGDNSERFLLEGGSVTIPMEVLRQVTNNFSEANILGRGGFGVVYAGELHDGTKTAVKRMECSAMGNKGMNEFQAEIAVLTKVRHRHLVALLGYCVNGNERLLVYEYMPQGNLGQHLFEYGELGYPPLTWKQRVSIALDVARGVEYLHSLAQQSFIHRDLKPSNILLGDDMRAKVADFGLVKNAPDGKYSVETRLAGTFGYLAPEYAATGRVTTKVDVYAFGVVLMEMITGRKALDDSLPDERSHLVTWFRRILINKENIPKAIDQTLEADEETLESIHRVAELAGHCTAREPQQRPDMGHAVNVLGPLVEKWKPSCQEEEESFGIDVNNMSLPQALQRWQQNEGTSTSMFHGDFSYSQTQSSIPPKPSGFPNTFDSADGR
ncbi:LOW QUALITY PROTEIN: receptor-like kinase TMK4 [Raphanus sativus]|uniref:non-specific serine/threonine protein kinase n=1 Tax=Raphanus sativus TaxID=3726 RepID=A0A9W3BZQ5_RAPSA|nr:LOW QUALITY PROTEIN: receptor-like kinase TMK4 [Raphanus sativus]